MEKKRNHVKTEAEVRVRGPPARDHLQPLKGGRGRKDPPPEPLAVSAALLTL